MKPILFSVLAAGLLISIALFLPKGNVEKVEDNPDPNNSGPTENVVIKDGKQIINIDVKGGYNPRKSIASADMPTIIRMKTAGYLDCSSAVVIPDLKYQEYLPLNGETDIEVPPQSSGKTLNGMCAMGMYRFSIAFK